MRAPFWTPPTDVFENENEVIVRMEIAGMREEDFNIELNGRILTVRGFRQDISERRAYHQMEIRFGEFSIDMELPSPVDVNRVEAMYNNGFLRVVLPKTPSRSIRVAD